MTRVTLTCIGVALVVTAISISASAQSQASRSERQGATQPMSPVSMVSWVTESGSGGTRLDLAIVWRGEPEWFIGSPQRSSAGGTTGRYSSSNSYGEVTIDFTLLDNPRRLETLGSSRDLGDNNVVFIDGTGSTSGPRIIKALRVDPHIANPGAMESVLKTSPEVVAFIGCDVTAPTAGRQPMFDVICARLR